MRTAAIIFIPENHVSDGDFALRCIAHCKRRGYSLFMLFRDWPSVIWALDSGRANVVVVAEQVYRDPAWRPRLTAVNAEPEGQDEEVTMPLRGYVRKNAAPASIGDGTRNLSLRMLDETGPIPAGLDRESIEAARRIARALDDRR